MIPIIKPDLDDRELNAIRRVLGSGWVAQGPEVKAFEDDFARHLGASHACAVSSCTTALFLALKAAGVGEGNEVITVSHSFIATANSIRHSGATPVFVDIDPATFNMNPDLIERVITPRTKAILCVHQIGMPCDLGRITEIGRKHGIPVIEDAACAAGSEILWNGSWEKIGKPHGDAACFSFHPRKLLTTGEGGMITTRHAEWDARFRLWRQHAMSVPDTVRHGAKQVIFESYVELGYNFRMTDIQAAVGRAQLGKLLRIVEERRRRVGRYRELLQGIAGLGLAMEPSWARSNWQSFAVRLPEGCAQRDVMQSMLDDGVSTRRGVMASHREPAYAREPWSCGEDRSSCGCSAGTCRLLRESEIAQDHTIVLPLYHQMTDEEQDKVVESLQRAVTSTNKR